MKATASVAILFALCGCTNTSSTVSAGVDNRGGTISGNASATTGDLSVTPSNTVTVPIGTDALAKLFPNGFTNVKAADLQSAQAAVPTTVPESKQDAVAKALDMCGTAIDKQKQCNVASK